MVPAVTCAGGFETVTLVRFVKPAAAMTITATARTAADVLTLIRTSFIGARAARLDPSLVQPYLRTIVEPSTAPIPRAFATTSLSRNSASAK